METNRETYRDIEKDIYGKIAKEQQRLFSNEISEDTYEERFEALMQDFRLRTMSLLNLPSI